MANLRKSKIQKDRRQTNKCHLNEKITTQKANAIAATIKKELAASS